MKLLLCKFAEDKFCLSILYVPFINLRHLVIGLQLKFYRDLLGKCRIPL